MNTTKSQKKQTKLQKTATSNKTGSPSGTASYNFTISSVQEVPKNPRKPSMKMIHHYISKLHALPLSARADTLRQKLYGDEDCHLRVTLQDVLESQHKANDTYFDKYKACDPVVRYRLKNYDLAFTNLGNHFSRPTAKRILGYRTASFVLLSNLVEVIKSCESLFKQSYLDIRRDIINNPAAKWRKETAQAVSYSLHELRARLYVISPKLVGFCFAVDENYSARQHLSAYVNQFRRMVGHGHWFVTCAVPSELI